MNRGCTLYKNGPNIAELGKLENFTTMLKRLVLYFEIILFALPTILNALDCRNGMAYLHENLNSQTEADQLLVKIRIEFTTPSKPHNERVDFKETTYQGAPALEILPNETSALNRRALDYKNRFGIRLLVSGRPSVLDGAGARYSRDEKAIIAPISPLLDQSVRVGSWEHEEVHAATHYADQNGTPSSDSGNIIFSQSSFEFANESPTNYSRGFLEDEVRAYCTSAIWIVDELVKVGMEQPENFQTEYARAQPALQAHLSAAIQLARTRNSVYKNIAVVTPLNLSAFQLAGIDGYQTQSDQAAKIWKPGDLNTALQLIEASRRQAANQVSDLSRLPNFGKELSAQEIYVRLQATQSILKSIVDKH